MSDGPTEFYSTEDYEPPKKVKAIAPTPTPPAKELSVFEEGEDLHATKESAAFAKRAVRQRWNVDPEIIKEVMTRARKLVNKETKTVATMRGEVEVDAADTSIAAMKVILAANGQDQADDHLEIRIKADTKNTDRDIIRKAQSELTAAQADALAKVAEELSGKLGDQ